MRGLLALVIGMGVLIVLGVGVVATTIVRRMAPPEVAASRPVLLDEPAGTRMVSAGAAGERVAVVLQGGGPDRLVLVDLRTGAVAGRVALAR